MEEVGEKKCCLGKSYLTCSACPTQGISERVINHPALHPRNEQVTQANQSGSYHKIDT